MTKTSIEWTEHTWNPIVGCSIVSPGCKHCYAMKQAARTEAMGISRYDCTTKKVNGNVVWTGKIALAPEQTLLAPLKRKKPTTYFVNSMGDLFHENCPDEWIDRVFAVMALSPQHTYQVLTKRAARMRGYMSMARAHPVGIAAMDQTFRSMEQDQRSTVGKGCMLQGDIAHLKVWPLPNVWLGVSTERQQEADERIPLLLQTPAAVRFISAEPLLGPIDLTHLPFTSGDPRHKQDALDGQPFIFAYGINGNPDMTVKMQFDKPMTHLDWVIVGGESGPHARPMHPDWARRLRDQCAVAGVPFFFKQWGAFAPGALNRSWDAIPNDHGLRIDDPKFNLQQMTRVGKKAAGRLLDGIEHNGMPERHT
jgi:protein gp37